MDTESRFKDVVFVTSAYGLGETVVGGTVNPDEWCPAQGRGWWMDDGWWRDVGHVGFVVRNHEIMDFSNFDAI